MIFKTSGIIRFFMCIFAVILGAAYMSGLCSTRVSQAADMADKELSASSDIVAYLRDATVAKGHGTVVALEVRNSTTQPTEVDAFANYRQEPTLPPGTTLAREAEDKILPSSDHLAIDVIVRVPGVGSSMFWTNREADHHNPMIIINPGKSAFLKIDIPSTILVPGKCFITFQLRQGDKIVGSSETKTIECLSQEKPPTTAPTSLPK